MVSSRSAGVLSSKMPCLFDHTICPCSVGSYFAHRILHFENGRTGWVDKPHRHLYIAVLYAIVLLNQVDLARVNGGLAHQAVSQVFVYFLGQQG